MLIKLINLLLLINLINSIEIRPIDDFKYSATQSVWTWKCTEKGCQKNKIFPKNENTTVISENVCNLLCPPGNLWPHPNGDFKMADQFLPININSMSLNIKSRVKREDSDDKKKEEDMVKKSVDIFKNNFKIYERQVKNHQEGYSLVINLLINSLNIFKYKTNADESYQLNIERNSNNMLNITIISETFLGMRHGLETLSQLLVFDHVSGQIVAPSSVTIVDHPAYTHRGITLDTARNYITIPAILRTLDAMAVVKLNTLHWHITDSQSFPLYSNSYPNFTKFGAYGPDKIYSEEDVNLIVDYARLRGIRIVPEFDLPAHVGEGWSQVSPESIVCFNSHPWQQYCVEPPCGQIDPTVDKVYEILQGLYTDFNELFDSDLFHMGGDEVNINCWNTTEHLVENMIKMNLTRSKEGFHRLWSQFQDKAKKILKSTDKNNHIKRYLLWTSSLTEDKIEDYLNNEEYIIQIWTKSNDHTIKNLLLKNYQIILSNYDALYLDCGFGAWVGTGNNWCSPYIPWQKVYENTPENIIKKLNLEDKFKNLILGSEVAIWTEQIDDSSLDNRLWPRAAAMAESLWSPGKTWQQAERRYILQRERLINRGVLADTVVPEWCRQNQGHCYQ